MPPGPPTWPLRWEPPWEGAAWPQAGGALGQPRGHLVLPPWCHSATESLKNPTRPEEGRRSDVSGRQGAPSVPRGPRGFAGSQAEACGSERRWPARASVLKDLTEPGSAMSPHRRPRKSADRASLLGPESAGTCRQRRGRAGNAVTTHRGVAGGGETGERALAGPGHARRAAPGPHKP